jgi:hypothetical protein
MIAVWRIERHHQEVMADDTLLIGDKREKTFAGDLGVDAAPLSTRQEACLVAVFDLNQMA